MRSLLAQRMLALLQSLAVHGLVLLALIFGMDGATDSIKPRVPLRIQAVVVSPAEVNQLREQKTDRLRDQAIERRREEQRIAAEEAAQRKARDEAAAQARERQAQLDREKQLDEQRQQQIEELRRERERIAAERKREEEELAQLADQRRQQEDEAARKLEEERLKQLMDIENQQLASTEQATLEQEYIALIQIMVTQNWRRPPSIPQGLKCRIRVDQTPGGEVVSAQIMTGCAADEIVKRSIVDAVHRAAPLPYRGFEDVFRRQIIFRFEPDG